VSVDLPGGVKDRSDSAWNPTRRDWQRAPAISALSGKYEKTCGRGDRI